MILTRPPPTFLNNVIHFAVFFSEGSPNTECLPECHLECHPECQDQLDMARSHTVMVLSHLKPKKSLVVSGEWWVVADQI